MPKPHRTLRQDFGVFADPGFLIALVLLLLLFAAGTAALIYGTSKFAIPLPWFA